MPHRRSQRSLGVTPLNFDRSARGSDVSERNPKSRDVTCDADAEELQSLRLSNSDATLEFSDSARRSALSPPSGPVSISPLGSERSNMLPPSYNPSEEYSDSNRGVLCDDDYREIRNSEGVDSINRTPAATREEASPLPMNQRTPSTVTTKNLVVKPRRNGPALIQQVTVDGSPATPFHVSEEEEEDGISAAPLDPGSSDHQSDNSSRGLPPPTVNGLVTGGRFSPATSHSEQNDDEEEEEDSACGSRGGYDCGGGDDARRHNIKSQGYCRSMLRTQRLRPNKVIRPLTRRREAAMHKGAPNAEGCGSSDCSSSDPYQETRNVGHHRQNRIGRSAAGWGDANEMQTTTPAPPLLDTGEDSSWRGPYVYNSKRTNDSSSKRCVNNSDGQIDSRDSTGRGNQKYPYNLEHLSPVETSTNLSKNSAFYRRASRPPKQRQEKPRRKLLQHPRYVDKECRPYLGIIFHTWPAGSAAVILKILNEENEYQGYGGAFNESGYPEEFKKAENVAIITHLPELIRRHHFDDRDVYEVSYWKNELEASQEFQASVEKHQSVPSLDKSWRTSGSATLQKWIPVTRVFFPGFLLRNVFEGTLEDSALQQYSNLLEKHEGGVIWHIPLLRLRAMKDKKCRSAQEAEEFLSMLNNAHKSAPLSVMKESISETSADLSKGALINISMARRSTELRKLPAIYSVPSQSQYRFQSANKSMTPRSGNGRRSAHRAVQQSNLEPAATPAPLISFNERLAGDEMSGDPPQSQRCLRSSIFHLSNRLCYDAKPTSRSNQESLSRRMPATSGRLESSSRTFRPLSRCPPQGMIDADVYTPTNVAVGQPDHSVRHYQDRQMPQQHLARQYGTTSQGTDGPLGYATSYRIDTTEYTGEEIDAPPMTIKRKYHLEENEASGSGQMEELHCEGEDGESSPANTPRCCPPIHLNNAIDTTTVRARTKASRTTAAVERVDKGEEMFAHREQRLATRRHRGVPRARERPRSRRHTEENSADVHASTSRGIDGTYNCTLKISRGDSSTTLIALEYLKEVNMTLASSAATGKGVDQLDEGRRPRSGGADGAARRCGDLEETSMPIADVAETANHEARSIDRSGLSAGSRDAAIQTVSANETITAVEEMGNIKSEGLGTGAAAINVNRRQARQGARGNGLPAAASLSQQSTNSQYDAASVDSEGTPEDDHQSPTAVTVTSSDIVPTADATDSSIRCLHDGRSDNSELPLGHFSDGKLSAWVVSHLYRSKGQAQYRSNPFEELLSKSWSKLQRILLMWWNGVLLLRSWWERGVKGLCWDMLVVIVYCSPVEMILRRSKLDGVLEGALQWLLAIKGDT